MRKSSHHTLIADESIDICIQKVPISYFKYRVGNEIVYKTVFRGMVKLKNCNCMSTVEKI